MERLILHEDRISGNCYKIRLVAALLGLPIERRQYDVLKQETRTEAFLAQVNANGRIPVLQIGDRFLPESNAACWYLASRSPLVPDDRFEQADMLRWMFFEQYSHEPYIATSRFWLQHKPDSPEKIALLASKRDGGWAALKIMETHLAKNDFFVSDYNIADIALFAYTHVAHEGGFLLDEFPNLREWIERVKTQPGFVPMR